MNTAQCWITVEDSTGAIVGDGPIYNVIAWSSTAQLSKAGKITFSIAANDPRAALLAPKRVVRCYAILNDTVTAIGAGIVDKLQWIVGQDATILQVTGDDLLRELAYRSVRNLALYTETTYSPTGVVLYNGGTYKLLPDCFDGNFSNADDVTLAASNSFLYVGYSGRFNTIMSHQGSSSPDADPYYYNSVAGDMNYGYSNSGVTDPLGAWPEFDTLSDNTAPNGDNVHWPQSLAGVTAGFGTADVLFQRNANWDAINIAHAGGGTVPAGTINAYWVRYDSEENLNRVRMEEFVIGVRTPLAADVAAVMALAGTAWTGWAAGTVTAGVYAATTNGTYAAFAGESVLSALTKIAKRSGENFRLGPDRQVHWLRDGSTPSGVVAVQSTGRTAQYDNVDVCAIASLERIQDTYDLVTRIYPYGAGMGAARVSLVNATLSMPSGYTLTAGTANYIESTAGTAAYGVIERVLAFKDARSVTDQTYDTEEACNELAQLALNWLQRHDGIKEYYRLTVVGLSRVLQVGTTIRVVYREVRDGAITLDIDGDYLILAETHAYSGGRLYTVGLDIGETDAWPATDEEIIADMIEQGTIYEAHPQPIDADMIRWQR